jgi:hypothetical protein
MDTCVGDLAYALLALASRAMLLQYEVVRWVQWIGNDPLLLWFSVKMLVAHTVKQQNLTLANFIRPAHSCGSSGGSISTCHFLANSHLMVCHCGRCAGFPDGPS